MSAGRITDVIAVCQYIPFKLEWWNWPSLGDASTTFRIDSRDKSKSFIGLGSQMMRANLTGGKPEGQRRSLEDGSTKNKRRIYTGLVLPSDPIIELKPET